MVSVQTHTFKTVGSLEIKLDIYTLPSIVESLTAKTPVFVWWHGGGVVDFNRKLLPYHVVQTCLSRGWPLIAPDYRLLPQATGRDIVEDTASAYEFVRNNLFNILTKSEAKVMENVIIGGGSGGGYVAFTAAHYLDPRPLGLLVYYASPTVQVDFYTTGHKITQTPPVTEELIAHFLTEPATTGSCSAFSAFDPESLLEDLSQNKDWVRPPMVNDGKIPRHFLYPWFIQTNQYPELTKEIDRGLDHPAWKDYPKTIIVHGDKDWAVPYSCALDAVRIIGPHPAQLFTAQGQNHGWDTGLFLGDPELEIVEEAWKALDVIVKAESK